MIAGETDPERLADLPNGRLKASRAQLVEALHGRVTPHHRFLLDLHLGQIEAVPTSNSNWPANQDIYSGR